MLPLGEDVSHTARHLSLVSWMRAHLRATDGPGTGEPIRLEPWQRGLLRAIDRDGRPIVCVRAAAQVGKTLLAVGVGLRAAVDQRGVLLASATDTSIRDLARRLDATLDRAPALQARFPSPRSGPGARASWKQRHALGGGWLALAAAGSASQLASRTAAVAVADEIARWPARVRSGEGHPLALLRARLADWHDDARLIAISSPVMRTDAICTLYADGDRRRLAYRCPSCRDRIRFDWEMVAGREKGETPVIACPSCGELHGEAARRRMLASARWVPTRDDPTDEDVISFALSRLDSARATLNQVCKEWRRARRAVARGERDALRAFRNLVLGLPGNSGAADVDRLYELRGRGEPVAVEQVTAGVDVQTDRLVYVVLGFGPGNARIAVLDYGSVLGDPTEADAWAALGSTLAQPSVAAGMPVSVVSVDAGFSTTAVRTQCGRRRWWIPVVGRAGEGKPIARPMGAAGIATMGKDDTCAWWSGRVASGAVRLPEAITRADIGELCASEALQSEGGRLVWRPVEGRPNHLWDAAGLAVHARHFRPLAARRRGALRLRAVS